MKQNKLRKPTWLLAVAASYAAMPGCSDDDPTGDDDRAADVSADTRVRSGLDAGLVARPPGFMASPPDTRVNNIDGAIGVVIVPPDAGNDAGSTAQGVMLIPPDDASVGADAASEDAAVERDAEWLGLVVLSVRGPE